MTVIACGLLAGCGSNAASTRTPTGVASTGQTTTASAVSTVPASSSATPPATSTSSDLTRQAEQVYRRQFALTTASYKAGGIAPGTPAPAPFKALLTGQALSDTMSELGQIKSKGIRYMSGTNTILAVIRSDKQRPGSVVALQSCDDGRSLTNRHPDGTVSHGRLVTVTSYFTREGGQLKLMYYFGKAVSSCDVH